eukprot:5005511-Alexandrium_andersonii.AAC.1
MGAPLFDSRLLERVGGPETCFSVQLCDGRVLGHRAHALRPAELEMHISKKVNYAFPEADVEGIRARMAQQGIDLEDITRKA